MSLICIMYWALSLESFHKWCTSSCVVRYRISISSSNRRAVDRCSRDTVRVNRAEAAGLLQDKCSNCTSGQINIMLGYVGITFFFNPVIPSNLIQRLVNHGNLSCSYLKSPLIQEAYPESPGVMSKQRKHLWAEGSVCAATYPLHTVPTSQEVAKPFTPGFSGAMIFICTVRKTPVTLMVLNNSQVLPMAVLTTPQRLDPGFPHQPKFICLDD